jgi:putative glutamine amidotransferase
VTAPLIGLSTRRWPATTLGSALPPAYADAAVDLGIADYPAAVAAAGGLPVHLARDAPAAGVVGRLDGLILTGGADIDPRTGGQQRRGGAIGDDRSAETGGSPTEPERDAWELALLRAALDLGVPVLCICRGLQLLNVACGGTLVEDLPAGAGDDHPRFAGDRRAPAHEVIIEAGSLAARVYGERVMVNSLHHQAVDRLGDGLVVAGRSPDGTVEVMEMPGRAVLAVQWHPEALPGDPGPRWLVDTAS